jgi:hypothetical protein
MVGGCAAPTQSGAAVVRSSSHTRQLLVRAHPCKLRRRHRCLLAGAANNHPGTRHLAPGQQLAGGVGGCMPSPMRAHSTAHQRQTHSAGCVCAPISLQGGKDTGCMPLCGMGAVCCWKHCVWGGGAPRAGGPPPCLCSTQQSRVLGPAPHPTDTRPCSTPLCMTSWLSSACATPTNTNGAGWGAPPATRWVRDTQTNARNASRGL